MPTTRKHSQPHSSAPHSAADPLDRHNRNNRNVRGGPRPSLTSNASYSRLGAGMWALPVTEDQYGVHDRPEQASPEQAPRPSLDVVDMESELAYWRSRYLEFVQHPGLRYCDYEPAVKLGLDAYMRGHGRHVSAMRDELQACYRRIRGTARLDWEDACLIVERVWRRLHESDRLRR